MSGELKVVTSFIGPIFIVIDMKLHNISSPKGQSTFCQPAVSQNREELC